MHKAVLETFSCSGSLIYELYFLALVFELLVFSRLIADYE